MYFPDDDSYYAEFFGDRFKPTVPPKVVGTQMKPGWLVKSPAELPMPSDMTNFIRADDGCYEIVSSSAWGVATISVKDPEANTKLTEFDKNGIKLVDNFPKLPKELWSPIIGLYFHYCKPTSNGRSDDNEVSVVLLRQMNNLDKWKVVVPKQVVTGASVRAEFSECCDIITGQKYDSFPPIDKDDEGNDVMYVHAGSSHSHNTMNAFFSSTDNQSELGVPGMHIVVGEIDLKKFQYVPKASIVLRGERKDVDIDLVVDTTPYDLTFHKNCLDMVTEERFSYVTSSKNCGYGYSTTPISRPKFSEKIWAAGAMWNNETHTWDYGDTSEGTDVVTTQAGTTYKGRICKIDEFGLIIKTGTNHGVDNFVGWAKLGEVGIEPYEKSLEDTDTTLPALVGFDDDFDDDDFYTGLNVVGHAMKRIYEEEEGDSWLSEEEEEDDDLARKLAFEQLYKHRNRNK